MTNEASSFSLVCALLLAIAGCSGAGCSGGPDAGSSRSEYTGQENRQIKALSAQEVSGYLEGEGMGFSKVAELNQHPGPKHVLDLAEALRLTGAQHRQVDQVFREMRNRARELGRQLVEKEQRLDSTFASDSAREAETEALLQEIGALRAQLRFTHVRAHMQTKEVLSPVQIERYDESRGYGRSQRGQEGHSQEGHSQEGHDHHGRGA